MASSGKAWPPEDGEFCQAKQGKDRVIVFPSTDSLLGWYSI